MRKSFSFSSYLPKAAAVALAGGMALLSGCGLGTIATDVTPEAAAVQIDGTAFGGSTAISGATVTLYVSGTTGYGSAPTYSTTASAKTAASTGAFSFSPAFSTSSCTTPAQQIVYLTVSGGDPTGNDATGNTNNHAILLASVIGTCSNLTNAGSLHVAINEATTVAAAYALSGFSTVSGTGGSLATLNIGAPSTNSQGLLDAAANALLLVTSSSTTAGLAGGANASTATVELPTAALNTIANSITPCVNASEYNVSPCSGTTGLFALATPPGGANPTNVYQATLNIAKYPGQNVSAIMQLGPGASPFQPNLAVSTVNTTTAPYTAPNDLTLGIAYTNAVLGAAKTGPVGIAIDSKDNVWVLGAATSADNYIAELPSASAGGNYSPTLTSIAASSTIRNGAFDTLGNLWVTDKASTGSLIEFPYTTSINPTTYNTLSNFSSLTNGNTGVTLGKNDYSLAIDAKNDLFTVSYGAQGNCENATNTSTASPVCEYVEWAGSGTNSPPTTTTAPTNLFNSAQAPSPTVRNMVANTTSSSISTGLGDVWSANYGNFTYTGTATAGQDNPTFDGSTVSVLRPSTGALSVITLGSGSDSPWGIALDASGNAYVTTTAIYANSGLYKVPQGQGNATTINSTVTANSIATIPDTTSTIASKATAGSAPSKGGLWGGPVTGTGTNAGGGLVAVDGAGNVWAANYGYGDVVEYSPTAASTGAFLSPYYGFSPSISTTTSPSNQSVFTCTTVSSTTTCAPTNTAIAASNTPLAIDRAGSVWTMDASGTLLEIIGTAAPTNPVLASGGAGSLP